MSYGQFDQQFSFTQSVAAVCVCVCVYLAEGAEAELVEEGEALRGAEAALLRRVQVVLQEQPHLHTATCSQFPHTVNANLYIKTGNIIVLSCNESDLF